MKPLAFILLLLLHSLVSLSQKNDYVWITGYGSNYGNSFGNPRLDFNNNPLKISRDSLGMGFWRTSVNFCDDNGKLLFYSNGSYIANDSDETIQNSDNLNAGVYTEDYDPTVETDGYPIYQDMLAFEAQNNQYLLLHSFYDMDASLEFGYMDKIYETYLDMSANNSKGTVVFKNKPILEDTVGGEMVATRHGNGRDWWVLAPKVKTNCYYIILVSDSSVKVMDKLTCGNSGMGPQELGNACFSPDGSKYVHLTTANGLNIFDFDRCSGELTGLQTLQIPDIMNQGWYLSTGLAISPNNRFLYVSLVDYLLQFDLTAPDIIGSVDTVGVYDSTKEGGYQTIFNRPMLAPDGKIYVSSWGVLDWHVINNPDLKGDSCNFTQHSVRVNSYVLDGVPNNYNYRLTNLVGSECDTIFNVATQEIITAREKTLKVFPNPANEQITVDYGFTDWSRGGVLSLTVYNSLGQPIYEQQLPQYSGYQKLDIHSYSSGFYYVSIKRNSLTISTAKFVKQ